MCCFWQKYHLHSTGVVGADRRFVVGLLSRVRAEFDGNATQAVAARGG